MQPTMDRSHSRDHGRRHLGVVVAAVTNARPQALLDALLANRENRRRNHDKSIVHVDQAGFLARQQIAYVPSRVRCPNGAGDECKPAKARILFDFIIIAKISQHFVAGILEHEALLLKNKVFPARLLIWVVHHQDLHLWWDSPLDVELGEGAAGDPLRRGRFHKWAQCSTRLWYGALAKLEKCSTWNIVGIACYSYKL